MVIRPATQADLPAVLSVFEAAKAIMRADGNLEQWSSPGFPGEDVLLHDIALGGGFVMESVIPGEAKESVIAYFALLPSPEPTYGYIDGAWLSDGPYGVIHRIASFPDIHGVFSSIIDFASARYPRLRIDTHRDNRIMRHVIGTAGFTYCGVIWLADGTERLAYER